MSNNFTILEGQVLGMCSSSVRKQSFGVGKDNQQYHCLLEKHSTKQVLEQPGKYIVETLDGRLAPEN